MKKKLLLLSFIEGATVMAAELCGARLLAPVFGTSLSVWASVMGMTLSALALGYFYGGYLTHKHTSHHKMLGVILLLASLSVCLMTLVSAQLIPVLAYFSFSYAVILSSASLLFLPIFLLGASSPFFIRIQVNTMQESGKVSGMVYAISTSGGILSTYACGFYFIPLLGIHWTLLAFGILLFLCTLLSLGMFKIQYWFGLFCILLLAFNTGHKEKNVLLSQGLMGELEVKEMTRESKKIRVLSVNGIIQTEMDLKTRRSHSTYIQLMDSLIGRNGRGFKKALVLGLGGGLICNRLFEKGFYTTAVELDARIIEVAQHFFYLNPKIRLVQGDARYFLNQNQKVFDLLLVDLYKSEELPAHVLTLESLTRLHGLLSDSARILINWHGYLQGELGQGSRILYNTLRKSGFETVICSNSADPDSRNLIFVASKHLPSRLAYRLNEDIAETDQLNTDDAPVLETANAAAEKRWRLNYLKYNLSQKEGLSK